MSDDLKMFAGICMIVFGTFGFLYCLASAADQTTTVTVRYSVVEP